MYKINPNYIFSQSNPTNVKVISLNDEESQVYTLKGIAAQVFVKLVSGENLAGIKSYISGLENPPPTDKIDAFLSQFVADMSKLGFIQTK